MRLLTTSVATITRDLQKMVERLQAHAEHMDQAAFQYGQKAQDLLDRKANCTNERQWALNVAERISGLLR